MRPEMKTVALIAWACLGVGGSMLLMAHSKCPEGRPCTAAIAGSNESVHSLAGEPSRSPLTLDRGQNERTPMTGESGRRSIPPAASDQETPAERIAELERVIGAQQRTIAALKARVEDLESENSAFRLAAPETIRGRFVASTHFGEIVSALPEEQRTQAVDRIVAILVRIGEIPADIDYVALARSEIKCAEAENEWFDRYAERQAELHGDQQSPENQEFLRQKRVLEGAKRAAREFILGSWAAAALDCP